LAYLTIEINGGVVDCKKSLTFIFLVVFIFLFMVGSSLGQTGSKSKSVFGIKCGLLDGNTFKLSEVRNGSGSYDGAYKESGLGGGFFLDIPVGRRFYAGFSIEVQSIKILTAQNGIPLSDDSKRLLEVGANFKFKMPVRRTPIIFKPGIELGLGILSDAPVIGNSRYLIFKTFLETVLMTGKRIGFLGEIGFWSVLKGGNDEYNITMGPTLMLRGGMVF
jgi:hypothetical protein